MSVNTAHVNNGVLIHSGECILLFSDNVTMEISGNENGMFKGTKTGRIYLTTHRMIFNNKSTNDPLQSFSFPFVTLNNVEIEQPVFGANFIKGYVSAQENGNWNGQAKFKLLFKSGGALEFGQAMLRAASMAMRNNNNQAPPPYSPPQGSWYQAPPPAYTPNPQGYYGWVPPTQIFPQNPPADSVFMTDNPPPYPGIVPGFTPQGGASGYGQNAEGFSGGYPGAYNPSGYPNAPGGSAGGYAPPNGGGFANPNYPGGYPPQNQGGYPNAPGSYPGQYPNYPNNYQGQQGFMGYNNYNPNTGPMGGFNPSSANSKEAEAAQSAYYDPNHPQTAYVPPPAYYEPPPSYNSLNNKKSQ